MRASTGAIERVRIDRSTLEPRFKVIGSELWSDDPGFETVVNDLGLIGACGSGIIEVIGEMYLAGEVTHISEIARQLTMAAFALTAAVGAWRLGSLADTNFGQYVMPLLVLAAGWWVSWRIVNFPRFAAFLI
mgnify:CR=1 FL=1